MPSTDSRGGTGATSEERPAVVLCAKQPMAMSAPGGPLDGLQPPSQSMLSTTENVTHRYSTSGDGPLSVKSASVTSSSRDIRSRIRYSMYRESPTAKLCLSLCAMQGGVPAPHLVDHVYYRTGGLHCTVRRAMCLPTTSGSKEDLASCRTGPSLAQRVSIRLRPLRRGRTLAGSCLW